MLTNIKKYNKDLFKRTQYDRRDDFSFRILVIICSKTNETDGERIVNTRTNMCLLTVSCGFNLFLLVFVDWFFNYIFYRCAYN